MRVEFLTQNPYPSPVFLNPQRLNSLFIRIGLYRGHCTPLVNLDPLGIDHQPQVFGEPLVSVGVVCLKEGGPVRSTLRQNFEIFLLNLTSSSSLWVYKIYIYTRANISIIIVRRSMIDAAFTKHFVCPSVTYILSADYLQFRELRT